MKILVEARPNSVFGGFQLAAEKLGHEWIWWEESHTPAFDVFDDVQPDWIFAMQDMSRALVSCIEEFANAKVVIGYDDTPTSFTRFIKRDKPVKFAFTRHLVDTHRFYPDGVDPALECDIAISGEIHPVWLDLCQNSSYNIKIIHEQPWPVSQYLGMGSMEFKRKLYNSAKLVGVSATKEAMRVLACGSIPIAAPESEALGDWYYFPEAMDLDNIYNWFKLMQKPDEKAALHRQLFNHDTDHSYHGVLQVLLDTGDSNATA